MQRKTHLTCEGMRGTHIAESAGLVPQNANPSTHAVFDYAASPACGIVFVVAGAAVRLLVKGPLW